MVAINNINTIAFTRLIISTAEPVATEPKPLAGPRYCTAWPRRVVCSTIYAERALNEN